LEFYGTIGPACAQLETLQRMVEAGMTGIRMNLSHGPLSAHKDWLDIIHAVGIPQLLIDLQGPELRIGTLPQPLVLEPGQNLRLGQGGVPCPAALVHAARPGQNLLLDDGRLLVQVAEAAALQCTVVRGGTLQSRKSLAAPGLTVASPTLTEEDLQNLQLAGACGVTGVMLPFVRGAEDIRTLRRALEQAGAGQIRIFAKIESLAGVQALPEFLPLVDEVVIARGDLGNAMPLWELPRCQKQLSAVCRSAGVPFMVVTQMLDSMCSRAVPTRAEVSDIYNAVADGASSVMLTGETAAGQYPVEAMEYLVRTARTALE
jgi:pyruvate kinase